jgi:surface polysaccharide O-acyltransferase-like enzyme
MLVGLYLLTPILRVMVAHFTDKLYKYFICLWSIGVMLIPLIDLVSNGRYQISEHLFIIPLFVGYFVIGTYLTNVKIQHRILATLTILGLTLTAIGTFILAIHVGGGGTYYFQEYFSPTMILASISFFMLLNSYAKPKEKTQMEKPSWKHRIMHVISENTLPLYLLHVIIIYLLQHGFFFGFTLTGNTVNSIIGVPLMTVLTLGICLIIIIPLKKIPIMRKLIG